jgi:hypothetical protein
MTISSAMHDEAFLKELASRKRTSLLTTKLDGPGSMYPVHLDPSEYDRIFPAGMVKVLQQQLSAYVSAVAHVHLSTRYVKDKTVGWYRQYYVHSVMGTWVSLSSLQDRLEVCIHVLGWVLSICCDP